MKEGRIVKALSGFYYVQTANGRIYECRGRGVFRNNKITPLVGDNVEFLETDNGKGYVKVIHERKNELIRPPIANVSQALIVTSITEPQFSPLLLDRFLVIAESKSITPMIIFTKVDLASEDELTVVEGYKTNYEQLGYEAELFALDNSTTNDFTQLKDFFKDEITVVMGQSGVGKSTLLNKVDPSFSIKTGEISQSLGRGKHTTRHVEFHQVNDGLVADTPGFSSIDFEHLMAEDLSDCFVEFKELSRQCKFRSCLHDKEPKCGVKVALETGEIQAYRYENYLHFLTEILSRKPRY